MSDVEGTELEPGRHFWPCVLAMVVVAALLAPSLQDSGFILDDTVNISRHANDGDVLGEWTTATYTHADPTRTGHVWRPIPASMQHFLAMQVGRESALPFRLLTLAFHLLNVGLVYALGRRLRLGAAIAGLGAAVAGTHAVVIEAACWASCLFDVSMTTVVLLTLLLLPKLRSEVGLALGATFAGIVATLCKESAIAFAPLLFGWMWLEQGTLPSAQRARQSALAGLAYLSGVVGVLGVHDLVTAQTYAQALYLGKLEEYASAWVQAAGWWFNLPMTAPLSHSFMTVDPLLLARGILLLLVAVAAAEVSRRSPSGTPLGWMALLAWLSPLVPAAIVVAATGTVSIRLGYAGLLLAAPFAIAALRTWFGKRGGLEFGVALVIAAVCMTGSSFARPAVFRTEATLWEGELEREPTAWALARAGRFQWVNDHSPEALAMWKTGIEGAPSGLLWLKPRTEWWDYAQAAFLSGQPTEALFALDQISELTTASETMPAMHACLRADALDQLGRHPEAQIAAAACR